MGGIMRKMKKGDTVIEVKEWFITTNAWEYFITDDQVDKNTVFGLVMGMETELGYVYVPEVLPYIRMKAEGEALNEIMPAEGWEWVE